MLQGVKMIDELKEGVEKFMIDKGFNSVQEIVGKSLPYFSTHMDLVQKMKAAKRSKAGEASRDNEWAQKDITENGAGLMKPQGKAQVGTGSRNKNKVTSS